MAVRVAILASGGGSTAEVVIRAAAAGDVGFEVGLVICNMRNAGIFTRVQQLNTELGLQIEAILINSKTHPAATGKTTPHGFQTAAEEAAILHALQVRAIDIVTLLGYMKRVGPQLVQAYGWRPDYTSIHQARMLNTHPGLLPETKGLFGMHVQEHVLLKQLPEAGQTLHVVAREYDEGPTVAEHRIPVRPGETAEELFARVQRIEKQFIATDIDAFINKMSN